MPSNTKLSISRFTDDPQSCHNDDDKASTSSGEREFYNLAVLRVAFKAIRGKISKLNNRSKALRKASTRNNEASKANPYNSCATHNSLCIDRQLLKTQKRLKQCRYAMILAISESEKMIKGEQVDIQQCQDNVTEIGYNGENKSKIRITNLSGVTYVKII